MPIFELFTNLSDDKIPEGAEERITAAVGSILTKPLERITVVIVPGVRVYRKQSNAPACFVRLSSIAVFDKDRNLSYTEPILDVLVQELGISRERASIIYYDLDKDMLGN